ncbi:hypothetical protein PIB30_053643, partial [Stylosanthes scabra]|nr:hypothetical protein [Stylosanthes scabra]
MEYSLSSPLVSLQWTPPAFGVVKINYDASKMQDITDTGFGCIIRDNNGTWQHGCAGCIPDTSALG